MTAAADWLDRQLQLGRDGFARGRPEPVRVGQGAGSARAMAGGSALAKEDADDLVPEESDNLTELLRACLVALRLPSHGEIHQPRRLPFWSVSDAARRIGQLLPQRPAGGASLEGFLPDVAGQGAARRLHHRSPRRDTGGRPRAGTGRRYALQQAETRGSIMLT